MRDFRVIRYHEILKRYETFSRKEGAYTGFLREEMYRAIRRNVPSNYKKCTDALTNSVHSSGWTTRDPSASGLCQNDGLQAVVVWQLRLHTSHISEQPEGKHRLRILLE